MPAAHRLRGPRMEAALITLARGAQRHESEQLSLDIIKETSAQLRAAGLALRQAAEQLKAAGKGVHANAAIVAARTALEAADGLAKA